jgi:hypothetical protein
MMAGSTIHWMVPMGRQRRSSRQTRREKIPIELKSIKIEIINDRLHLIVSQFFDSPSWSSGVKRAGGMSLTWLLGVSFLLDAS